MNARVLCALTLSALVTGCAPAARVFLLPQPDGSASGVVVTTRKDQRLLNQPYQVADIAPSGRIEAAATSFAQLRLRLLESLVFFFPGWNSEKPSSRSGTRKNRVPGAELRKT